MTYLTNFINDLSRKRKWSILLTLDIAIIFFALYVAFSLRYSSITPYFELEKSFKLFPLLFVTGSVYVIVLGLPKIKLHTFEIQSIKRLALCALLLTLSAMSFSYLLGLQAPRSIPIIFGSLFFLGTVSFRTWVHYMLMILQNYGIPRNSVIIYGAGVAGAQLAIALRQSKNVLPIAFVDDNPALNKLIVAGLNVYSTAILKKLVNRKKIKRILIAIPSLTNTRRNEILRQLESLSCVVQILPSYVEMIERNDIVDSLRFVSSDELLGREKFDITDLNVASCYRGKSILVSGAGGSIGSELCRQILDFLPSKIILLDNSELALYEVERKLRTLADKSGVELVEILASVCDYGKITNIFENHGVQIVLHAAAYKHVPLVESNELSGLQNNVLGTYTLAQVASDFKVEQFVLISTDKAVRPTNVMGATKRLAELVIQDIDKRSANTVFSMVRFGNVLGSSGSVIPLFREQIARGGPITLTHENVTRFFMAISEAAHLVLIAGNMATGGDVFVLDMGEPVKIKELAQRMIKLTGLKELNDSNPDGDIRIVATGLRPGEKLYEELLIGKDTLKTPHPKILRARETCLSESDVSRVIKGLRTAIDGNDVVVARALIVKWVDGYHQPKPID